MKYRDLGSVSLEVSAGPFTSSFYPICSHVLDVEKAYILGAGSSATAGAPLIRDFKTRVEDMVESGDPRVDSRLNEALALWNKTVPEADVEEFYILADLLDRLDSDDSSRSGVEGVRYLIAKTLELSMGTAVSEIHRKFVHKVWEISQGRGDFVVISMNWDIAVDNAAYTHSQFSLDYGYDRARSLDGDPHRNRSGRFPVFKLHGSLNWWLCQGVECQALWYRRGVKDVSQYWEEAEARVCEECGKVLVPLMVPPTAQKFEYPQRSSPLRVIWTGTRESLQACQELAVVGYSFPPTDVQFRMLVLEALSQNSNLRRILIVTSPKYGSRKRRFEDRYAEVFGQTPHGEKLDFFYKGYETWVERSMPFEGKR